MSSAETRPLASDYTESDLYATALTCHQNGQFVEAEALYLAAINASPQIVDAHHNLGILFVQKYQAAEGLQYPKTALDLKPTQAQYWLSYIEALLLAAQGPAAARVLAEGRRRGLQGDAVDALEHRIQDVVRPMQPFERYNRIAEIFAEAVALHQAGRFSDAEAGYMKILSMDAGHSDALHMVGVLASQHARFDVAIDLILRAISNNPSIFIFHFNLGNAYRDWGRPTQSVSALSSAIVLQPDFVDAYHNIAQAIKSTGKIDSAIRVLERARTLNPASPIVQNSLGLEYHNDERVHAALSAFEKAIALQPDLDAAYNNLGNAFQALGIAPRAIIHYRRAVEINSNLAEAFNNLANALQAQNTLDEAIEFYGQATKVAPNYAEALWNMGSVLVLKFRIDEAIAALSKAVCLAPENMNPYLNLGVALLKSPYQASTTFIAKLAVTLAPESPEVHFLCSYSHLRNGRLTEGWKHYEWRKELGTIPDFGGQLPIWDGHDPTNARLLLRAEQGLGDTIHFVRYARLLAERGARVVLAVQPTLVKLLSSSMPDIPVISMGDSLPELDAQVPLMSLPRIFETTLATIPAESPYLSVESKLSDEWRRRLGPKTRPRIGIAWSGNPNQKDDFIRSMPLEELVPILELAGIDFYVLQKDIRTPDRPIFERFSHLHQFDLGELDDTAALISQMDLVISVCTSVAHLSAALGKETHVLISAAACWRWLTDRVDSPWYPSVCLWRQKMLQNWSDPVHQMRQAITSRAW
jgi:tetratricopeptide (TPR) repeat protein